MSNFLYLRVAEWGSGIGYVVTITPNFCLLGCVFDMYLAAKQKMILIRKVGTKVAVRGWMIYRWP